MRIVGVVASVGLLLGASLCAQKANEVIGEVQLANGPVRPFVSFASGTMRYTTFPVKRSADNLMSACDQKDSRAEWSTVQSMEFIPFGQGEKEIAFLCWCSPAPPDKASHPDSVSDRCGYKKANIVLKNGKKLTGAYVYVSDGGVRGPDGEAYSFAEKRVRGFTAR